MTDSQHFDVPAGRMAYIDTGGVHQRTVVFVHGNPSSAAEFAPVIELLRDEFRCIAVDHIGFGQSDKPTDWDYLPSSHAANLARLLDSLDLRRVTMVVGDWGGPIGLSWVLDNSTRVDRAVITNTWLWPVNRSLYYQGFSKAMGWPLGRYLIRHHNVFARWVVKGAWGERIPLTDEIQREFTDVHPVQAQRKGMWVFPGQIIGSTDWLAGLWERRDTLRDLDLTFLWGMRDIAFRPDILQRWIEEFPDARVVRLDDVGHFVCREAPEEAAEEIRR